MSIISFNEYFRTITGRTPFNWQTRVADLICANKWSDALLLPPASGKTSLIEIWYYCLYVDVIKNQFRNTPIRLWWVVDRKLIVDSANESAKRLQNSLQRIPALAPIAEAIKKKFGVTQPLVVGRIRGGMERSEKNAWITTPNQPTVICSTIDQYGSRLLFRGYGASPKSRSIHASMAAMDSLVALDEAHLSQSLKSVIRKVNSNHKLAGIPDTRVIELTATGNGQRTFLVSVTDDAALAQRQNAKREIKLVTVPKNKKMTDVILSELKVQQKSNKLIAVVVNSVKKARDVFEKIQGPKVLLIGRLRNHERSIIQNQYLPLMKVGRNRLTTEPLVVVSTQTIEVGADLDFDSMISEAAPQDCLIQRFGRLNRIGEYQGVSQGIIVYPDDEYDIYGGKTKDTFQYLSSHHSDGVIPNFKDVTVDTNLFADSPHIGKLSPSLINVLAHTHPSMDVNLEPILHGARIGTPNEFSIVYRSEINEEMLEENPVLAKKLVNLAPPVNNEILTLPKSCLYQDAQVSDAPYAALGKKAIDHLAIRWSDLEVICVVDAQPGDLLIVPCEFGRHDAFGWNPNSLTPTEDVYDLYGSRIRLHPKTVPGFKLIAPGENGYNIELILKETLELMASSKTKTQRVKTIQKNLKTINPKSLFWITADGKGIYFPKPKILENQKRQGLYKHNLSVSEYAEIFAKALGLSPDFIELFRLCGLYHDIGKADHRFQEMLYYPDIPDLKNHLAKSKTTKLKIQGRRPKGWRHELQSAAMVIENNLHKGVVDPDLMIHLIASHHGWFRPFMPLVVDSETFTPFEYQGLHATKPYYEVLAERGQDSFSKLNEKYGYWGMTLFETILRLADHAGSK